jgi:hypothetical protein
MACWVVRDRVCCQRLPRFNATYCLRDSKNEEFLVGGGSLRYVTFFQ